MSKLRGRNQRPFGFPAAASLVAIVACGWFVAAAIAQESPLAPPTEAPESAASPGGALAIDEYEPIFSAPLIYPVEALGAAVEGDVTVRFTIAEDGTTTDIVVVESSDERLEVGAIEAVEQSTFKPRTVAGAPVAAAGVTRTYRFQVACCSAGDQMRETLAEQQRARDDESWLPIVTEPPVFPSRARRRGITSAWVLVEYTVTAQGRVAFAKVIESSSELFERAALRSVRDYRYEPRRILGWLAIEVPGMTTRVTFEIVD